VSQKNRTPVTFSNNSNNPISISTNFGTKNRQLIDTQQQLLLCDGFFETQCRLDVVSAAVSVACYLAVLFRKCTCYRPVMEYCMYCNDALLERIKTDRCANLVAQKVMFVRRLRWMPSSTRHNRTNRRMICTKR